MCGSSTGIGPCMQPGPDVGVDAVERRGGDADPDLPGAGGGQLDVLDAQDLGVAVLVESHCLHGVPPSFDRCASNPKHFEQ